MNEQRDLCGSGQFERGGNPARALAGLLLVAGFAACARYYEEVAEPAPPLGTQLRFTTIDPSLALARDGTIHVTMAEYETARLLHAWRSPGERVWNIQVLAETASRLAQNHHDIQIGDDGVVHALFLRLVPLPTKHISPYKLVRATWQHGQWREEVVAGPEKRGGLVGWAAAWCKGAGKGEALSSTGVGEEGAIQVALRGSDGRWRTEVVDQGVSTLTTKCVIERNGIFHVVFPAIGLTSEDMRYARRGADGAWVVTSLANPASHGASSALAVAPDGTVYVLYLLSTASIHEPGAEFGFGRITLATRSPNGAWSTETIVENSNITTAFALAVAEDGIVIVATGGQEGLTVRTRRPGDRWRMSKVGTGLSWGFKMGIHTGPENLVHVAFSALKGDIPSGVRLATSRFSPHSPTGLTEWVIEPLAGDWADFNIVVD